MSNACAPPLTLSASPVLFAPAPDHVPVDSILSPHLAILAVVLVALLSIVVSVRPLVSAGAPAVILSRVLIPNIITGRMDIRKQCECAG